MSQAEEIKLQGNLAFKEHRYNAAVKLYTDSLKIEQNHLVFGNRGLSFLKMGQLELALRDVNAAIRLQPAFAKNYYRRCQVLRDLGMITLAKESLATATRLAFHSKELTEIKASLDKKENSRSIELKQWDAGDEDEDEMISVSIGGVDGDGTVPQLGVKASELTTGLQSRKDERRIDELPPPHSFVSAKDQASKPWSEIKDLTMSSSISDLPSDFDEQRVEDSTSEPTSPKLADSETRNERVTVIQRDTSCENSLHAVDRVAEKWSEEMKALPPPATNFLDFLLHFNTLKATVETFGRYFLSIPTSDYLYIFSNLLNDEHLAAIVIGLEAVARKDASSHHQVLSSFNALVHLPRFDIVVLFVNDDIRRRALALAEILPRSVKSEEIKLSFA